MTAKILYHASLRRRMKMKFWLLQEYNLIFKAYCRSANYQQLFDSGSEAFQVALDPAQG